MATNNSINAPIPFAIAQGGTGVTSVTTSPTASSWAGWDANKNLSANSLIDGYTTTATAAGTTTLLVGSTKQQYFTGATTQTVLLPVTSTLALGQSFYIVNNSSGVVTVQSSGANTIQAMAANTTLLVTVILTSGTTAASWNAEYLGAASGGTVSPGTINQLAWYAATGSIVSGLATANSGVLVTSAGGVPSISSTLPSGIAATNMNLTTPSLGVSTANSINFGGTALANYVQGTWTPIDGSGAGLTFTSVNANYTRIGNIVIATCNLTYPVTADISAAIIGGLPISGGGVGKNGGLIVYSNVATAFRLLMNGGVGPGTTANLYTAAGAVVTNNVMSGSLNYFQIIYHI